MRNYELMTIHRPELGEDEIRSKVTELETFLGAHGATVTSTDLWGKRRFAYEIDHIHEGYYSVVTFDEETWSVAQWRSKREQLSKLGLPFLVAESPTGQILGYALVAPLSTKSAYRFSVENSIYLGQAATGKGLGHALLEALIEACEEAGIRQMVAIISDKGAEGSIKLHEKLGFVEVGRMGRVGYKFGRWLGTVSMQKSLKPAKKGLFGR